jgi:hypothetical protein
VAFGEGTTIRINFCQVYHEYLSDNVSKSLQQLLKVHRVVRLFVSVGVDGADISAVIGLSNNVFSPVVRDCIRGR